MSDPKTVVRNFLETFSSGDVDAILDGLADDATWWVSGSVEGMSGTSDKAAFGALLRQVKPIYTAGALRITPSAMIAEGNVVAVEAESFAELVTGGAYANRYHFLFEVEGTKVRRVKEYSDTLHMRDTFTA